ncbi:DNA-processing protein DprA [Herbiconiux sp. L3-i23]|uniref:DNA-processing protein DprA n=1 Tax=Herbiconiux sp. L3-i23 TaxID=2905871 RepID=UPI00206EA3C1|nr:DNA-processing protein DprA [Herbiconiux sp. L3-i23]BDI21914.1 DNA processing protein DprA [Herbiconiux sp. L3-i23]
MILGLDDREVSVAVSRVRPDADAAGQAAVAELFARAAWSGIAEPGDGVAGALIGALGSVGALQLVVDHVDADRVKAEVAGAGGSTMAKSAVLQGLARWRPRLVAGDALAHLDRAARVGARLLTRTDPTWPRGLDDLGEHAPVALWLRGDPATLSASRSVALVGARAATTYGESVASELADGLAARGVAVVSGGAYGIDGIAHRATLACGGRTIAFLAGGVDRFYPPRNSELLAEIVRRGAVVSEMPVGATPTRWRFLQRNRLIAAMSDATVVVEAGIRSGSINTAGHASSLGRPLGTVPGPITSPASAGCHRLLRDYAAVCVTDVADVVALLPGADAPPTLIGATPDPAFTRVLDAMSGRLQGVESIAKASGLAAVDVRAVLGLLELEAVVVESGGRWRRT